MSDLVNATLANLPTLEQIRQLNKGRDVPPEAAWIWGEDDEASDESIVLPFASVPSTDGIVAWPAEYPDARKSAQGKIY